LLITSDNDYDRSGENKESEEENKIEGYRTSNSKEEEEK